MVNVWGNITLRKVQDNGILCCRQRKWVTGYTDVIFPDIQHSSLQNWFHLRDPTINHVCQVRFTPRETTFTASNGKLRNVFDIVKIISSVLSTQKLNCHPNWAWLNLKHHFSYQFAVTASHTRQPKCLQEHKRSNKPSSLPGIYIKNVTEEASHKKIDMFLNVIWFIITWQYHH